MPVMTAEWVDECWRRGLSENIIATDPVFTKYGCPVFYGLTICISQVPKKEKEQLKTIIEDNGK